MCSSANTCVQHRGVSGCAAAGRQLHPRIGLARANRSPRSSRSSANPAPHTGAWIPAKPYVTLCSLSSRPPQTPFRACRRHRRQSMADALLKPPHPPHRPPLHMWRTAAAGGRGGPRVKVEAPSQPPARRTCPGARAPRARGSAAARRSSGRRRCWAAAPRLPPRAAPPPPLMRSCSRALLPQRPPACAAQRVCQPPAGMFEL